MGGNSEVGDNSARRSGGNSGGSKVEGGLQPLRTVLHTISVKSPKQFELKQS